MNKQRFNSILFVSCLYCLGTVHQVQAKACPTEDVDAAIGFEYHQNLTVDTTFTNRVMKGYVPVLIRPSQVNLSMGYKNMTEVIKSLYTTEHCACVAVEIEVDVKIEISGCCVDETLYMMIKEVNSGGIANVVCSPIEPDFVCTNTEVEYRPSVIEYKLELDYFDGSERTVPYNIAPGTDGSLKWSLKLELDPDDIIPTVPIYLLTPAINFLLLNVVEQ